MNMHLGTETHSFIVANLGNRITITRDLWFEALHSTRLICFVQNKLEAP